MIVALFSDDELMEKFVLKGGNALDIVYNVGTRSSVDVDLSMPDDFADIRDAQKRMFRALRDRFDSAGFVVFDENFQVRPSVAREGQSPDGEATKWISRSPTARLSGVALLLWTVVGRAVAQAEPAVRLESKTKGARLSLARIGFYYRLRVSQQMRLTAKFVREHLPPPQLRVFKWLTAPQK